jgi:signal transduction histidine kinase
VEMAAEDAQLASSHIALANAVDAHVQVLADPDQLHRILVNLMRNARQAIDGEPSGHDSGTLTVDLRVEDGVSIVRIADDGPGLPGRARANLFQPFLGSARPGGAGLGLAISRELAQAHGGDLTLAESTRRGAVFELRLPGAPDALPARGQAETRQP